MTHQDLVDKMVVQKNKLGLTIMDIAYNSKISHTTVKKILAGYDCYTHSFEAVMEVLGLEYDLKNKEKTE